MPNDASPSLNITDAPEKPFNFGAWAKQYWYILAAIGIVLAFVMYNYMRNASAQVGPSASSAQGVQAGTDPNAISTTQPDQSNLIDMLSTQYQDWLNRTQNGATSNASTNIGPDPDAGNRRRIGPAGIPAIGPDSGAGNRRNIGGGSAGRGGAHVFSVAGVPPSGPAVPFGTHVTTHDPLRSDGSMFTNERAV